MRAILVIAFLSGAIWSQAVWCGNGHTYSVVSVPGGVTWTQARSMAMAAGGDLATVTSAAEDAFIKGLLQPGHWQSYLGPWLCGTQSPGAAEPSGGWGWANGEPMSYLGWSAFNNQVQPNNGLSVNENCIHYLWPTNPGWNDLPDTGENGTPSGQPIAFVLEIPTMIPPPSVGALDIQATTTGGGVGDLSFQVVGIPCSASHAWILLSSTPAPGGLGSGPLLGLQFPDPLLLSTLAQPAFSGNPLHFPVSGSPYALGPIVYPPGTFPYPSGFSWEMRCLAYEVSLALVNLSPVRTLIW